MIFLERLLVGKGVPRRAKESLVRCGAQIPCNTRCSRVLTYLGEGRFLTHITSLRGGNLCVSLPGEGGGLCWETLHVVLDSLANTTVLWRGLKVGVQKS